MLKLMEHQTTGIEWLRRTPRALLADEPGLGKSAQALLAATEPLLIVSPAMLHGTWQDEVARWRPDIGRTWVSYSSLCAREGHKVIAEPREQYRCKWGTIIFDEAHYLKSRKAKWTKAAIDLATRTDNLVMLTGTPIPNWAHELYIPLRLMHQKGDTDFSSYWRWVERYFTWWTPPYGGENYRQIGGLKAGISWEDFAEENDLDRLMMRRLRDEVLKDLPALTEQTVVVPMTTAQRKAYDELKKDYFTFVAESAGVGDGEAGTEVAAFSDGGLHIKLAKVTTGLPTLVDEPEMLVARARVSCKIDALRELLEEREGSPVVVFCHFRSTAQCIELLGQNLGRRTGLIMGGVPQAQRNEMVRSFQCGDIDLLVGTLGTLAEGVTLTRSSTCIFVERSWVPNKNEQAMRRLHRIGQTAPVSVIYIVTQDSLDQRILALLTAKTHQQMQALSAADFAGLL
jgi:SNF2 family DNA or RNA helicase